MANEKDVRDLQGHAEERVKKFGNNALIKVRGTLVLDLIGSLGGAQAAAAKAATTPDSEEHAEIVRMRGERDDANSAKAIAEKELALLRAVAEAGEGGKKKDVNAALKAYRAEFPSAAGNTAAAATATTEEGGGDDGGEGGEGEAGGDDGGEAGGDDGNQGGEGGGE
jgi:hypothetical protein